LAVVNKVSKPNFLLTK